VQSDIVPDGKDEILISNEYREIAMRDVSGEDTTYQCVIDTYLFNTNIKTRSLQHNNVVKEMIKNSQVLVDPPKGLILIILAKVQPTSDSCHLVNIRWPTNSLLENYSSIMCKELYRDTLELLNHDGLDATRSSGSNGVTIYSNYGILRFLKTNSAFPRKGKGVKVVKRRTKWRCCYLAAGGGGKCKCNVNRIVKSWQYSHPQSGGKFILNRCYLHKHYDVIKTMTIAKYNSALLSQKLVVPNIFKRIR